MINVHLNGDIVRCPDMREIQARAAEIRDLHRICKYNIHESSCPAWQIAVRTHKYCGRCSLAGSDSCPGHQIRTKLGKKEKQFKIDNQVYRKISSAAHYLVKESNNKVLFLTLTFPQFKKKVTYDETNKCFSKFVENLRTNYCCQGYIAVREFGEKSHRVHYHLLCSLPYIPFPLLNNAWCNAIKDISNGILPIGGETSIGRGILEITKESDIKINGEIMKENLESKYMKSLASFLMDGGSN